MLFFYHSLIHDFIGIKKFIEPFIGCLTHQTKQLQAPCIKAYLKTLEICSRIGYYIIICS
jgi:hypothetical protein